MRDLTQLDRSASDVRQRRKATEDVEKQAIKDADESFAEFRRVLRERITIEE